MSDVEILEDPNLTPLEKETTISFSKSDDRARVFSSERGLMRRLLAHSESELKTATVHDGDAYDHVDELDDVDATVVGVVVTVPVGVLLIRTNARKDTAHSEVVSDRVYGRRDAESGGAEGDR